MIGYGKRILLVDDERAIRELLATELERYEFLVVQAENGWQALREMESRHFDAVVTDYRMPHLNGLDLLRLSRLAWPHLPVIIMSGGQEEIAERAATCGAFACLTKPLDFRLLINRLSAAVEERVKA